MGKEFFRFGIRDVTAIREGAIVAFSALDGRCRLQGMNTDLTESDKQVIAWAGSVLQHLNRVGVTPPEQTQDFFPEPYTPFALKYRPGKGPVGAYVPPTRPRRCICDPGAWVDPSDVPPVCPGFDDGGDSGCRLCAGCEHDFECHQVGA